MKCLFVKTALSGAFCIPFLKGLIFYCHNGITSDKLPSEHLYPELESDLNEEDLTYLAVRYRLLGF